MFRNYFKVAWRNLLRKKIFSAINIFGLAVGLAIFALISMFVLNELSYDRYNENADHIFRINISIKTNGTEFNDRETPAPLANTLLKNYPQIESAVRISGNNTILITKDKETLTEQHAFFADSTLFDVFTLPMLAGNPKTALSGPASMVISASMAKKYFNSLDVIGKTLKVDNGNLYNITGIIKDMPPESHFHFNFIKSMAGLESSRSDFWLSNSFTTYVLLRKGTTQVKLDNYLKETAEKYAEPQLKNIVHSSFSDLEKAGGYYRLSSIPITKIHLYSPLSELEPSGNIQYVYVSAIIGLFILLIACINFMNLSTAQSAGRAKEVGVRKVIGSGRSDLISQFLTESLVIALVASILSIALIIGLLPVLNQLTGKKISLFSESSFWLFPGLLCVALMCGLLAGAYPAFVLSAFDPIKILKGKFVLNLKGHKLRNALVIFQFTIAIVLITGTLVIYRQLDYIKHKDIGYDREQILVLNNARALGSHAQIFKHEVMQLPGVVTGSLTGNLPTSTANNWNKNAYSKDATLNGGQSETMIDWAVDADYIPALRMEIVKGRNFSENMPTDSSAIIINETAARILGFKDPLNAKLYTFNSETNRPDEFQIIGVVKDFNAGSLRHATEPLLMRYSKYGEQFICRIKNTNIPWLIEQIENRYRSFDGMNSQPFLYSFLDEDFNNLYKAEQRAGRVFVTFAILAIFIGCLGLFGLASYAAEQRAKEIAIRKVLGSSVKGIIGLLSRDFIKLIGVAIIIATPLAWWAMNKWLENFAYRIKIDWWLFCLAGISAVLIALLTVGYQAIKAALGNPVNSLRSE